CAGLPNATGVTPLVAASSWPGEMVRALPGVVLNDSAAGFAGSMVDVPDEQAANVISARNAAVADRLFPNVLPMAQHNDPNMLLYNRFKPAAISTEMSMPHAIRSAW
ncbi:MAG: hypothetical protein WBR28_04900, partial [Mycobacterium sp.]